MLDVEKIKWMMHRNDSRWWEDDSWEIYEKLSKNMYETMDFLKYWTSEELEILELEILDLLAGFTNEFIEFLYELADQKSLDSLKESLDDYTSDEFNDDGKITDYYTTATW